MDKKVWILSTSLENGESVITLPNEKIDVLIEGLTEWLEE